MIKQIILTLNTSPQFEGEWNLLETQQAAQIFYNQVMAQVNEYLRNIRVSEKPIESMENLESIPHA